MRHSSRYSSTILFFIGSLIGASLMYSFTFLQKAEDIGANDVFNSEKIQLVKDVIQDEYYQFSQKSKQEIEDGVITSLIESLGDKHSSYFKPTEAKEFAEVLRGDFEGIGAVIDNHPRGILVRKIIKDSPAQKVGLEDGDIILQVDGVSMLNVDVSDAVKKIRGPKGSIVKIEYSRGDDLTGKTIEVVRDTIIVPSTYEMMLTGSLSDVGYIEVLFFGEKTPDEFRKSYTNLLGSGARALILDFRNNGGGYIDAAVELLSVLLPDDTLAVTTRENDPRRTLTLSTQALSITNTDIPIVMIVNKLSASATEIVAGALQDYRRGIIVGEKTYGKGSVQEPFVLEDGSILKLTIGRWYTPNDQNIDKNGITPDIIVPLFEADYTTKFDRQLDAAKQISEKILTTNLSLSGIIEEFRLKDFSK